MRDQVVTAKVGFIGEFPGGVLSGPQMTFDLQKQEPRPGVSLGMRPVGCMEDPQPDHAVVSCPFQEGPGELSGWRLPLRRSREEKRHLCSAFPAPSFWETADLSTLAFLSLQCLLFTVNSNLAVSPVYTYTHTKLLTFWGVFVAGL